MAAVVITWALVVITRIRGGTCYLHERRKLLLTLAVRMSADIDGRNCYLHCELSQYELRIIVIQAAGVLCF